MKHRILWLNLLLLALVALAGWQLRERWLEARKTETKLLSEKPNQVVLPPATPAPPAPPVTAATYMEVASRTLFSPDRNPDVLPPPPPAPPVMPALPITHGMMTIEGRTIVIMSMKSGDKHHGYSAGDTIGDFKFVSVQGSDLTFDWNGTPVVKSFEELREKAPAQAAQNVPPPAAAAAGVTTLEVVKTAAGPGVKDEASGFKNCVANDSTPSGTVQEGYRKVVQITPFGGACRWEPVK